MHGLGALDRHLGQPVKHARSLLGIGPIGGRCGGLRGSRLRDGNEVRLLHGTYHEQEQYDSAMNIVFTWRRAGFGQHGGPVPQGFDGRHAPFGQGLCRPAFSPNPSSPAEAGICFIGERFPPSRE